jgi:hypothetical protein
MEAQFSSETLDALNCSALKAGTEETNLRDLRVLRMPSKGDTGMWLSVASGADHSQTYHGPTTVPLRPPLRHQRASPYGGI